MKDKILQQVFSATRKVRVIFATVALGMGVVIQSIRQVIHINPPSKRLGELAEMVNLHGPLCTTTETFQKTE